MRLTIVTVRSTVQILLLTICTTNTRAADQAKLEFFEKRIRPVLAAQCYECHGPSKQESNVRLDHRSYLLLEGNFGAIVVPGEPDQSQLFISLTHENEDLQMPFERDRLPNSVVRDFRKWIDDGAVWPEGETTDDDSSRFDVDARKRRLPWIWEPPNAQQIPLVEPASWPRNDIDRFVLYKLVEHNLYPAKEAAPEIWLRRVHFALAGLPPSPEQREDFIANPTEVAYAKVVDELLDSPHFGEHWARHWMDLVRYAESRGHESDYILANAWHYRDYLIRAFNADLPYDQFVREHLAGDLLPAPRVHPETGLNESVLATAWPYFGEEVHSPVDIRQDECDRLDNKIDVLSKAFLGLTVACARCHDHKFDAISQVDYYAMAGFILSSSYRQVRFESDVHNKHVAEQLDRNRAALQKSLSSILSESLANLDRVEELIREKKIAIPTIAQSPLSRDVVIVADFSDANDPWMTNGYSFGLAPELPGNIQIDPDVSLQGSREKTGAGTSRQLEKAENSSEFSEPVPISTQPLRVVTQGHARKDSVWDELRNAEGNQSDSGSHGGTQRAGRMIRTRTFTLTSGLVHYLFQGEARVYAAVDSHLMVTGPLHARLVQTIKADTPTWITHDLRDYLGHRTHIEFGAFAGKQCNVFKVVESAEKPAIENQPVSEDPAEFEAIAQDAFSHLARGTIHHQPNGERLATAVNWVLAQPDLFPVSDSAKARIDNALSRFRDRRSELQQQIAETSLTAVSMMDGSAVNENVLLRGKSSRPSDVAIRRLPSAFNSAQEVRANGSGRLELAHSLTDPKNPLVARVFVNRLWHHLFGRGIVASVDNFGWLGEPPTHRELLDHLAHTFVHDDSWSTKQLLRRIVLSNTFRMSSVPADPRAEQVDPKNLWLHRMPVRRLGAETIRDHVLSVSGRLDPALFGSPVPVHLDEFVIGRGRPSESGPLDGAGRRSIYTSVRRNFLPTMMLTFDMPIPFTTVGRRNVTNVPSQSLALANDKFIYQQARVWANRLLRAEDNDEDRVRRAYVEAFCRDASEPELSACRDGLAKLAELRGTSQQHEDVWTDLCHTLFRVNEFIFVR